jgi:hypothetical protein
LDGFEIGRFGPCSNLHPITDVKIGKVFHGNVDRERNGKIRFDWITITEWAVCPRSSNRACVLLNTCRSSAFSSISRWELEVQLVSAFFGMDATSPLEEFHQLPPNFLVLLAGPLDIRMQLGRHPLKRFSVDDQPPLLGNHRAHRYFHSPWRTKAAQ